MVSVEGHIGKVERRAIGLDRADPLPNVACEGRRRDLERRIVKVGRAGAIRSVAVEKAAVNDRGLLGEVGRARERTAERMCAPLVGLEGDPAQGVRSVATPSMPTAPPLPPLPTWCWPVLATTLHLVASSLLAPIPSAA